MTHNAKTLGTFWKYCLILIGASFLFFFLLHLAGAFFLLKLVHFEKYYNLFSWFCFIMLSLLFVLPQSRGGEFSIVRTLIPAAVFSVILVATSLIIGNTDATVFMLMAKCAAMCVTAFLLLFVFSNAKRGRKRKNLNFRKFK